MNMIHTLEAGSQAGVEFGDVPVGGNQTGYGRQVDDRGRLILMQIFQAVFHAQKYAVDIDLLGPLPIRKGKFFNVFRPDDARIVDEHAQSTHRRVRGRQNIDPLNFVPDIERICICSICATTATQTICVDQNGRPNS